MLGNLLAGTAESPGDVIVCENQRCKVYRGSASFGDKNLRGDETKHIEGEETLVPFKGKVAPVIEDLLDGIRSGFSYGGARTLLELQETAAFVEISPQGYAESLPHGKKAT